jgi:hypothetical protein
MRTFFTHSATRAVLALLVLSTGILLATRTGLHADDPAGLAPIHCSLTFKDLTRPEEQEWVASILKANGVDMESDGQGVAEVIDRARKVVSSASTGEKSAQTGSRVFSFTVNDPATLVAIHRALMAGRPGGPQPLFDAGEPTFAMTYATARLQGTLDVTLHFDVSPDAELFVKEPGGEEQSAGTSIDHTTGHVDLPAQIHRGQDFLYARTTRGAVQRYLKIDIYSGETSDIDRATYDR